MKKVLVTCHVGRHFNKFKQYDILPLLELGYEVHFASNFNLDTDKVNIDNKSHIFDNFKLFQIDFSRNPFSLSNLFAYFQLKKLLKNENYSLIHCQSPVGGFITRLAARKFRKKGTKVIYTAHGFHFYKGAPVLNWLLYYPLEKFASFFTDEIITINEEDYNLAKRKFKTKVMLVNGVGVDLIKFKSKISLEEKKKIRSQLSLNDDDIVLFFAARLDKNKNQIFLINSMEKLVNWNNNIKLLLAGVDDLRGFYQDIVLKKNLEKNVLFLGQRSDIDMILKVADIGVSSSIREGLPLHILECFASSLPVVSLKCRGVNELVLNDINGFVVNDEDEFIDKIKFLVINRDLIKKMKKNNFIKSNDYDKDKINNVMKKIFNEFLGE